MWGDDMPEEVADKLTIDDSWEAVNEYYFDRGWTDGLPIVPPTEERVAAMMEYTDRDPQEAVAVLEPKKGAATIEKIAVNAVMAGCLPQYMPVLIAVVQGIGKEVFNLYGVQTSTHNTSVLAIVNGPIAKELDINCGYNVTGNRWRSTAAIGRAIGFILTNIGGVPGASDIHTQGHIARFRHCIAENEDESPWEPLHVERGFTCDTSTVTVFGACTPQMIDDNGGSKSAKDLFNTFCLSIPYVGNRNTNGEGEPLIILGPQHANTFARDGYSKADVKKFFFERARLAGQIEMLFYKKHDFKKKIDKYKRITGIVCFMNDALSVLGPLLKVIDRRRYWKFRMVKSRFKGIKEGLKLYCTPL